MQTSRKRFGKQNFILFRSVKAYSFPVKIFGRFQNKQGMNEQGHTGSLIISCRDLYQKSV